MKTLLETVDSFKESTIRKLQADETSPIYELSDITDDVCRFDFPYDYSQRLGVGHDQSHVYCWPENDGLVFSLFEPVSEVHFVSLKPYLWNEGKWPKTQDLNQEDDSNFFTIPNYILQEVNMSWGDSIRYEWVEQCFVEGLEQERQVRCVKFG
jgi:hypothetical protein